MVDGSKFTLFSLAEKFKILPAATVKMFHNVTDERKSDNKASHLSSYFFSKR